MTFVTHAGVTLRAAVQHQVWLSSRGSDFAQRTPGAFDREQLLASANRGFQYLDNAASTISRSPAGSLSEKISWPRVYRVRDTPTERDANSEVDSSWNRGTRRSVSIIPQP